MTEAWWVNQQPNWMQWIQPRIQVVWTLGWKKQWLQTWMDWGEDHLFRSELWTLWVQDSIKATWCASVDKFVPIYSWVSSAYWWKYTMLLVFDTGDRWYEENKKKWAKDRALGYTCAYCCVGWGWRVNFNKESAVSQIGAYPGDDIARQTESMLKSVEKCGMVESIKCSGHVESSEQSELWFFQSQWFPWCHLWVWEERS